MSAPPAHVYEFGDFRLDAEKRLLWRGETPVPLTPRVFETLLYLSTPNGVTVPLLKLDPIWEPLRSDPRFEALLDKYGAKA